MDDKAKDPHVTGQNAGQCTDDSIVALYFARDEQALAETRRKYRRYCYAIAYGILHSREDAEECENDTYLDAWNAIPPHRPKCLSTFLGKITRRIAINRYRAATAEKRGGGEVPLTLDELSECIADPHGITEGMECETIAAVIDGFLRSLPRDERDAFLMRYWYFDSVKQISRYLDCGESRVKMMLQRSRERLRKRLREEGILI